MSNSPNICKYLRCGLAFAKIVQFSNSLCGRAPSLRVLFVTGCYIELPILYHCRCFKRIALFLLFAARHHRRLDSRRSNALQHHPGVCSRNLLSVFLRSSPLAHIDLSVCVVVRLCTQGARGRAAGTSPQRAAQVCDVGHAQLMSQPHGLLGSLANVLSAV